VEASEQVPVEVAMSIAIYDDELQQSVEPGTPTAKARLATVSAVREAGLDCSVFLMPILPFLTDSRDHLERAMKQVADAGGTSVVYSALHLRPGTKEWFMGWLGREHPELVGQVSPAVFVGSLRTEGISQVARCEGAPIVRRHGLRA
jgi:DNA repair photolyase